MIQSEGIRSDIYLTLMHENNGVKRGKVLVIDGNHRVRLNLSCFLSPQQHEALAIIKRMRPEEAPDPEVLRRCQARIEAGIPAYIIHPMVDKSTYELIGTRTFCVTFLAHLTMQTRKQLGRQLSHWVTSITFKLS